MRLSYETICSIAEGAVRIEQTEDAVRFHRFTEVQQEMYRLVSPENFYVKTFATSGIRLCFETDSSFLRLKYRMTKASGRTYGWFDVYENDVLIAHFGGDTAQPLSDEAEIFFRQGEKLVQIYFPWSAAGELLSMELEDGASVRPVQKDKTILAFGDSITQGYDAVYPSLSYISRITDKLNGICINQGIGGECFVPELLESTENISADLILVAYGSNDWTMRSAEILEIRCRRFLQELTARFPDTKILLITPIWRGDGDRITGFGGPLEKAVQRIVEICQEFPEITVIQGERLTPHLAGFYADGHLHPNDMGFGVYADHLYPEIRKLLKKSYSGR